MDKVGTSAALTILQATMTDLELAIGLCAAMAAVYALLSSRGSSHDEAKTSLLRRHPLQKIRAFPENSEGRIAGVASRLDSLLRAPMTGRECVAYVLLVHEYRGRRVGWEQILEVSEAVSFAVTDDTGRAVVRARESSLALVMDRSTQSDSLLPASSRLDELLEARGMTSVGRMLKYEEGALLVGERTTVFGAGRSEPTGDSEVERPTAYREQASCLAMVHTSKRVLLISNAPSAFE